MSHSETSGPTAIVWAPKTEAKITDIAMNEEWVISQKTIKIFFCILTAIVLMHLCWQVVSE